MTALREDPTAPYDVAAQVVPGADPAPYVAAGATCRMTAFPDDIVSLDQVRGVIRDGPAG